MRLSANPTPDLERRSTARVPLDHPGPVPRVLSWLSRRLYGDDLDVIGALLNNRRVMWTDLRFERGVGRWNALSEDLKRLAVLASASVIGCTWCIDFGHYLARTRGTRIDLETLREVPRWRESTRFTDLQRLVLAYAEAITATPPDPSEALVAELRRRLGEHALVELTMIVAVENQRSRFNAALGLRSQGLAERCEVPG